MSRPVVWSKSSGARRWSPGLAGESPTTGGESPRQTQLVSRESAITSGESPRRLDHCQRHALTSLRSVPSRRRPRLDARFPRTGGQARQPSVQCLRRRGGIEILESEALQRLVHFVHETAGPFQSHPVDSATNRATPGGPVGFSASASPNPPARHEVAPARSTGKCVVARSIPAAVTNRKSEVQ